MTGPVIRTSRPPECVNHFLGLSMHNAVDAGRRQGRGKINRHAAPRFERGRGSRKLGSKLKMSNAIKQSGAYLEIVSFHLGDQEFCIDIMAIREIRGWAPVTPMPHTPPYVLGLINLRGAVIPVIDMACRLGMNQTEPSERSAIIVTDIAGKLVGLLVEQVSDMMTIRSEDLQPAPEIIPEAQRAFCRGIVALEKSMVCFLNLDTVIADELAQAA